ncbi:SDR family NAD(P)-dependent oxidoreductase [Streptomyces sp. NPDC056486]|uniref:SDR family NAD(P)-dependent oxidoreductase n=1 Tax=Streptomyces sp. NPDC056486 TaxID=3345835 RepID=UPI0036C3AEFA
MKSPDMDAPNTDENTGAEPGTAQAARSGATKQTPLSRALATVRRLQQRLDEQQSDQPIAVIGVGLRLPGGINDLDGYWTALAEGRDLVRPMPAHRKGPFAQEWEGLAQRGGFLDEVLDFDADFFGISPREARHLDPQHRMLLEVTWEALENAALPADRLAGSSAGLYLGIMWQDYRDWLDGEPDAYWTTGNGHNFAAGRIAYALGLNGPALSVDTACSSSLVAVHLAVQALRRGECETAFAAGANLMMSPRSMRLVRETRSLSPDGLCRTFDARAAGFTRGEGCGAVVLKRLDHAVRDGDRVHAVIRGSAVNQDGRSGGFTAPNVLSQISLIESALASARLEPADIGFVEAHGTGTSLGDPIEMEALVSALGRRNGGAPLPVGAVKTNFGHLESAAGAAGLVKAMLCLRHRKVPPVVHFQTLNPRIDLSGTGITVPTALTDWSPDSGDHAAVSSFGMSGTNAQVILGLPTQDELSHGAPEDTPANLPVTGFEISARTPEALRALAASYTERLGTLSPADYPAFAHTATAGRARLQARARITAATPAAAADSLRALAAGDEVTEAMATGAADGTDGEPLGSELPRRVIDLPSYPWQRQRYAPEGTARPAVAKAADATLTPPRPSDYEVTWHEAPAVSTAPGRDRPALVLAGDDTELLAGLAHAAAARGWGGTLLVPQGAAVTAADGWQTRTLPDTAGAWQELWDGRPGDTPARLVLAWRATASDGDTHSPAALCAALTAAVAALDAATGGGRRALAVTRAARRTGPEDAVTATDHAALHGLAPVLGLELSAAWGGMVDLPGEPTVADLGTLVDFVGAGDGRHIEDLVAVREGRLLFARLRPTDAEPAPLPVHADGTYVVTGGLGAVGGQLTGDLVRRGARHLLLIGRRAENRLDAEATELLARLRDEAEQVVYQGGGCDTAEALAAACAPLDGMPPVRGVLHAAGSIDRAPAAATGIPEFTAALRDKASGAWWLHQASVGWELDFFLLVSSVSAVWGTEQCAAYSAANGALDGLVAQRVSEGLPAVSVAYGPWALDGRGMADAVSQERYARLGVGPLGPAAGCAKLTARVPGHAGHIVACPLDPNRFGHVMAGLRPRGLFAELGAGVVTEGAEEAAATDRRDAAGPAPEPCVVGALAELHEGVRPEAARDHVARILADVLGHDDPSAVRRDTGFFDLGLDSIAAVDLVTRLAAAFDAPLTVADAFDHPTVGELASHLLSASTGSPRTDASVPPARPSPVLSPQHSAPAREPAAAVPSPGHPEPVAIVGMAGRFPGADDIDAFWDLLRTGRDGVGTVPADRWDAAAYAASDQEADEPGSIASDQGGFLRDIDRFDAEFFGIPAREAENLDPQQRLLLESAWHALEDGRIDPRSLKGSRTGVFVGISYGDYARLLAQDGPTGLDAYYSTGTALNAAAGRIAYTLGLNGPAIAVDTACSSSLVALHLGLRSLRSGETDAVLAGGVNVILDPTASVAVSRAHMLSADGRCRTFSADATGFVRAEGCGVLVLKRLSDARRDGDAVLAVIRGSAVNQDGASSGLTAPSGTAQEAMFEAALADAATEGHEVSYLEAHGTGTALGDPIELGAAWRVLGPDRKAGAPLRVGSVKSNIGHCESAAGMASVIKTVLALRHGLLPGNLHFSEPNPHIDWESMNVQVVESTTPWRTTGGAPRVAGVSGFGFTGTNAHVVLAEAPAPDDVLRVQDDALHLFPLSAPDPAGLARLSAAWQQRIADADTGELAALAAAAGAGRAHFPHRRALVGRDREQLLAALNNTGPRDAAPHGRTAPRIAFLFSGQGSQYAGMGRDLYETEPVFRAAYDACDRYLAPALGASLTDLVLYPADPDAVNETRITQPALVALEFALAELWKSWGVTPSVVMGHSVGEISAALCAGVMDLRTGLGLTADRARLMQATERGAMLAVSAPEEDAATWAEAAGLDLAAVNGPGASVLSGSPEAVTDLEKRLTELGVRHRRLSVSHAFHSRLLDPALDEFADAVAPLEFRPATVPVVSNVTGRLVSHDEYNAGYWREHARRPVRFLDGVRRLSGLDVDVCLEIGPGRTLVSLVQGAGTTPHGGVAYSLRRGAVGRDTLRTAAGKLYELGQNLDWRRVNGAEHAAHGRHVDAPRYPFAPTRHWTRTADQGGLMPQAVDRSVARHAPVDTRADAPAWGTELRSPALRAGRVFATRRSTVYPAHLTDHRLFGVVSVPGASQTATVLSALGSEGAHVTLEDLHFPRALVLRDGELYDLQVIEEVQEHGTRNVSVQSLVDPEHGQWQEHLTARVVPPRAEPARGVFPRGAFIEGAEKHLDGDSFYLHLRDVGYHLGPSFRWIRDVWIDGDEALVRFTQPDDMNEDPDGYEIHPGLLDSCLQSTVAFAVAAAEPGSATEEAALAIPFAAARVSLSGRPARLRELWAHIRVVRDGHHSGEPSDFLAIQSADLHLFDDTGATVLDVERFRFRSAPRSLLERSLRERIRHAYVLRSEHLTAKTPEAAARTYHMAVLDTPEQPHAKDLRSALEELGHRVTEATADQLDALDVDLVIDPRFLVAAPDSGHPDDTTAPCTPEAVLTSVRTLADALRATPQHLPYAVLCAAPERGEPDPRAPRREALWAMLTALEAEQTERRLLRVAVGTAGRTESAGHVARALTDALDTSIPETRLEVGGDGVRAVRLVPCDEPRPDGPPGFATDGAALITGGLGALGLSTATALAAWGVPAITLMGRSAPDVEGRRVIAAITAGGTRVRIVKGDVTDPEDCRRAVTEAGRDAPLKIVLHLAGTSDDRAFERLDDEAFARVFAAKATGAAHLTAALEDSGDDLVALIFFSSVSGVLGSAGQANYAAANGFLDGLARTLRATGTPATSVAWGPWIPHAKAGLAGSAATGEAIGRLGITPLDDEQANDLLQLCIAEPDLTAGDARLVAVAVDAVRYTDRAAGHPRAMLLGGAAPRPGSAPVGRPHRGRLSELLSGLDDEEAQDHLRSAVRDFLAEVLGERGPIDDDLGFGDLGLDSIMVIDLRTRLSHALALDLPATAALDHPTVTLLTAYIADLRGMRQPSTDTAPQQTDPGAGPAAPDRDTDPTALSFDELVRAVQADVADLTEEK